jgi:hypothetical protein
LQVAFERVQKEAWLAANLSQDLRWNGDHAP